MLDFMSQQCHVQFGCGKGQAWEMGKPTLLLCFMGTFFFKCADMCLIELLMYGMMTIKLCSCLCAVFSCADALMSFSNNTLETGAGLKPVSCNPLHRWEF